MRTRNASVVYVLPDKLGGVFNFVGNLLAFRGQDSLSYEVVLTANEADRDRASSGALAADSQIRFPYASPPENLYAYLRRLNRVAGRGDGVLVANDWVELAMVSAFPTNRTVVNITHADSDYYYELARIHEPWIDCFVAYTKKIHDRLNEILPHRSASIFRIPYGVDVRGKPRAPRTPELKLLYVGRLDRQKGIFDLPVIDSLLVSNGCNVSWTIQGTGPDETELKESWHSSSPINWRGERSMAEVLALYPSHDVLVMPSRSEGLPVALLEAGAAGVVPVVSDLDSGIPEVVEQGRGGFRVGVGDAPGFAAAIGRLDADRALLESMSAVIAARVASDFDGARRALEYQALFSRWKELKRMPVSPSRVHYGSRLDKRWMPNAIVKLLRRRRAAGYAPKKGTATPL